MRTLPVLVMAFLASCIGASQPRPGPHIPRESGFVTTNDGARIYYESAGTGPAMLLIHGLGGNHAVWFQQVAHFARSHQVITISQRGFAPSSPSTGGYDNPRLVEDAVAVLDHLGVREVTVAGQSMGGWTAMGLALAYPDRVRFLVLSGTIAGLFDAEIREHYSNVVGRARELSEQPPPLARHPALGERFSTDHPAKSYLYQALASFGAPSPGDVAAGLGRTEFDDHALTVLRAPTLFVVGENDSIFPPLLVRRAAARITGSRVRVIRACGHSPYYEHPRAWNRAVEALWATP